MKKIITLICFVAITHFASAQPDSIDIKLQTILAEKNEDIRMDKLFNYFDILPNIDPLLSQSVTKELLALSETNKDKLAEAFAISQLSAINNYLGNKSRSLEFALKALKMAEPLNNNTLLAIIYNLLANAYGTLDRTRAIETYKQGLALRSKTTPSTVFPIIAFNLGNAYTTLNKLDSALEYLQLSEKLDLQLKDNKPGKIFLSGFARLYIKMNKPELANTYLTISLNEANSKNAPRFKYYVNNLVSEYFKTLNKQDSAAFYAQTAIASVKNTALFKLAKDPAKFLMNYYGDKNKDSALHYASLYVSINDSIANANKEEESYSLLFDEELRQRELKEQEFVKQQERKQNIQYALLALGIITFIITFLLLSRRHITNTKLIQFLGVVALLLVFEFLNLLLHPFLERITHHSPVLMLLALVCIAALLVPLHHKLEKWATHKLVEKNKAIRLAAAKKTIEELEKK